MSIKQSRTLTTLAKCIKTNIKYKDNVVLPPPPPPPPTLLAP